MYAFINPIIGALNFTGGDDRLVGQTPLRLHCSRPGDILCCVSFAPIQWQVDTRHRK